MLATLAPAKAALMLGLLAAVILVIPSQPAHAVCKLWDMSGKSTMTQNNDYVVFLDLKETLDGRLSGEAQNLPVGRRKGQPQFKGQVTGQILTQEQHRFKFQIAWADGNKTLAEYTGRLNGRGFAFNVIASLPGLRDRRAVDGFAEVTFDRSFNCLSAETPPSSAAPAAPRDPTAPIRSDVLKNRNIDLYRKN